MLTLPSAKSLVKLDLEKFGAYKIKIANKPALAELTNSPKLILNCFSARLYAKYFDSIFKMVATNG